MTQVPVTTVTQVLGFTNSEIRKFLHLFTRLSDQKFQFQAIHLSCHSFTQYRCSNSFNWPIDRILSGASIPDQSGPRRDGNEKGTPNSPSPGITGTSPLDCIRVLNWTVVGGVLPLRRGAVGIFYSPSRLGGVRVTKEEKSMKRKVSKAKKHKANNKKKKKKKWEREKRNKN